MFFVHTKGLWRESEVPSMKTDNRDDVLGTFPFFSRALISPNFQYFHQLCVTVRPLPGEIITFSAPTQVMQGEDKHLFIRFTSRILRWLPEERLTTRDLYDDPWLTSRPETNQAFQSGNRQWSLA